MIDDELLKKITTLCKWEDNEIRIIKNYCIVKKYKKGDTVFSPDKECLGFSMVISGRLKAYICSTEGKQFTIFRLLKDEYCVLTASCVMHNIDFDINVIAEENSEVLIIPAKFYSYLINENKEFNDFVNNSIAGRLSDVMWLISNYVFSPLPKRLAAYLIEQTVLTGSDIIKTTHDNIAGDLGTAREVISRLLKQFSNEELIIIGRGTIKIINKTALNKI